MGGGLGLFKGVLGLGLNMVHLYSDFASQGRRFRVFWKGVLGLGLKMVYVYYDPIILFSDPIFCSDPIKHSIRF
jgi:hypothetical protein